MRTIPAVLVAALLITGCAQKKLAAEEIRAALPASAALRIDAPAATGAGGATTAQASGPQRSVAAADPFSLALTSYLLANAVNGGVFWALAPVAFLTEYVPPTSCDETACTWGPGSSAEELNTWMLVVTKAGDGYDYTLSGARKVPAGSPYVPVLSGKAWPGPSRHRGHGTFHVDFDAAWAGLAHEVPLQTDFGTISVDYDARTRLQLDVTFLGGLDHDHPGTDLANPNQTNAVYHFEASDTGGDLKVGWRTAEPSVGVVKGSATLHTQWKAGGAGVADARFGSPDLAAGSTIVAFSQCWSAAPFTLTYDSYPGSTLTDPAACAIAPGTPVDIAVP